MDNAGNIIGPWLAADIVLLLIILLKLFQGRRQGVVKKLGKLAALVGGIVGGSLIKNRFSAAVSEKFVEPLIGRVLERTKDTLGIGAISENLGLSEISEGIKQILAGAKLPPFLTSSVADEAMESFGERTSGAIEMAVSAASHTIALRLTSFVLFIVSALLIFLIIKLIFNGVLDAVIRRLPLVKNLNRLLGAVIGALEGAVIAGLVLLAAYKLAPQLSEQPEALLSPYSVSRSYVVRLYFNSFPEVFS